jgi:hypothetical protein
LRETWYFGLQFQDAKNYIAWLKLDKKVWNVWINVFFELRLAQLWIVDNQKVPVSTVPVSCFRPVMGFVIVSMPIRTRVGNFFMPTQVRIRILP